MGRRTGFKPFALKQGDGIALIAPASTFPAGAVEALRRTLESEGYRPLPGVHIASAHRYLSGRDHQRAEDLLQAFRDPSVKAVFCLRGGYGSSRILSRIPFSRLGTEPKLFLGYSDITFLHVSLWAGSGWITFHGPNGLDLVEDDQALREVLEALSGAASFSRPIDPEMVVRPGRATGILLGGNLTCLTHLLGTPFCPDVSGCLLFLEDRAEASYRIDRMLNHLRLAGFWEHLSGLLLGRFADCCPADELRSIVLESVQGYAFPVVAGLPFGHGKPNPVLPLGLPFSLNTYDGTLEPLETPFRDSDAC
jgi:muramoyltetrapeptide carboxypeptidase